MSSDKPHVHEFKELDEQKVLLSIGKKVAKDTIKQRKCKCGKKISYDLERQKL